MQRQDDINRFYTLLNDLEKKIGGRRRLGDCSGHMNWPLQGVYFFFEEGEARAQDKDAARVVRVGSHAFFQGSQSRLWDRIRQHRGSLTPIGGDHRGSIFRQHVGDALLKKLGKTIKTWGKKISKLDEKAKKRAKTAEWEWERVVSEYLSKMTLLYLEVSDYSKRGYIEHNSISLLSNYSNLTSSLDLASPGWLGRYSPEEKIKKSGLWNIDHVDKHYKAEFIDHLETYIKQM